MVLRPHTCSGRRPEGLRAGHLRRWQPRAADGRLPAGPVCVVNQAGPTDLRTVKDEVAYDAASGQHSTTAGGRWLHNLGAAAFGTENLAWFGPAALAKGTLKTTRVLNAFSADDALVPWPQAADITSAMRAANASAYVDNLQLAQGTVPFAHGVVSQTRDR